MGTVEDWPVPVSILTQYGDSDCCVSGVMRHPCFWSDESGRQTLSILARPAPPCAIRWVGVAPVSLNDQRSKLSQPVRTVGIVFASVSTKFWLVASRWRPEEP